VSRRWIEVPLPDPINPVSVWEHTPADYYGSGEYPRFLRPVGPRLGDHPTERRCVDSQSTQPTE
jgi:hypothetical protein